ncbi:amino acid permease [Flavobacterium amniphilum]|uniref:APC family permease n=1 Tax=Flavobacterium amniphilum TaxID=1834035 RepID=UPI00202AB38B|nr:amino acid permease [Flavobacterium amniphilum]MCL9805253.1 amino acid permease [Flavobacterium amniphilum]
MKNNNELNRALGLGSVIVIVIGNVLGSGVYKKVAPMMAELNSSLWVLLAWLCAGIITLFGALCNAEIAGLLSATGGEYSYYKKIYNRFFAFMYGWTAFSIVQTAAISSLAYVFSQSINNIISFPGLLPELKSFSLFNIFFPFENFTVKLIAITLILVLTRINTLGVKFGTKISSYILLLVFIGLSTIIISGSYSDKADFSSVLSVENQQNTVSLSTFFTAMLAAFWAYQGWASVGFLGGEIKNPHQNIPKGIAIGVLLVIAIYLLVNFIFLGLLSNTELIQITSKPNGIAAISAIEKIWGETGKIFISILILITTLGCTHMTILASCRTYYAMSKENLFFKKASILNTKQVPSNSLLYQGIWASLLVLSGTFDQLTDMIIFAIFIFYGSTAFGVFVLRKKMPEAERPYKVWGYPIIPAVFVLFCFGLFINTIITRPREAGLGLLLILLGIPMYYWFKKKYNN